MIVPVAGERHSGFATKNASGPAKTIPIVSGGLLANIIDTNGGSCRRDRSISLSNDSRVRSAMPTVEFNQESILKRAIKLATSSGLTK